MSLRKWNMRAAALAALLIGSWPLAKAAEVSKGAPPASIPTFSTDDIARTGLFYAGGKYVGAPGKEVMGGSAYVEGWVPRQVRHPYPIVYLHGARQTATDRRLPPDGLPAWPSHFARL